MRPINLKRLPLLMGSACLIILTGCSSIAKGITEAVIDGGPQQDTRQCEIEGPEFDGIQQSLNQQSSSSPKITKVLMVHGISSHLPGYSSRLQKKLYDKLNLTITDSEVKNIELDSAQIQWKDGDPHTLGTLRITRHTNTDHTQELLFYELTWSPISEPQKQQLAADSANNEGLPRASINGTLKSFMNATVPDLLIYNGNGYNRITASVKESVCWMLSNNWENLPDKGVHECEKWEGSTFSNLSADDHFFITHSLGSRITIDTIQNFGNITADNSNPTKKDIQDKIRKDVSKKDFTVFMMANQLPLLQMGRDTPEVSNEEKTYCAANGTMAEKRVMRRMGIVAFSDPNDILSYPVPLDFTTSQIDSRICPAVTNVSLNIAEQKNLFDAASFANPMTAHSGYMEDDRVIDLIANGMKKNQMTPLVAQKCQWLETATIKSKPEKKKAN